ncbi:MAG: N-acetyltransferase [Nitrospinota bacterium]|jgi:putative acetyltransferase|nr:N-acetyltransferase [Nitrospinota bacterium]
MIVRAETRHDVAAVRKVVEAAFDQVAEADLVDALRATGAAAISMVADDGGEIVGHVLFSKLQAPESCLALAPVSVTPRRQNQGVGSMLVRAGLAAAKGDGWRAVFVLGEPEYYERFGFRAATADKFETVYPKPFFMALELTAHALGGHTGAVIYAPPFRALD